MSSWLERGHRREAGPRPPGRGPLRRGRGGMGRRPGFGWGEGGVNTDTAITVLSDCNNEHRHPGGMPETVPNQLSLARGTQQSLPRGGSPNLEKKPAWDRHHSRRRGKRGKTRFTKAEGGLRGSGEIGTKKLEELIEI